MEVGSIYGSYFETPKNYKGVMKEQMQPASGTDAGFAGRITEKRSVSPEDMTLEEYKKYFKEKMDALYVHPSQKNRNEVIDITDAAYKRMQTDPEYEKKVLNALEKNWAVNFGNYIPELSYTHIDDTWEKCYGYTKGMKENSGYSGSSSVKGMNDAGRRKKARQKEMLEEYLEKRAQAKALQQKLLDEKAAKQELERNRLLQSWNSERQMAKAFHAYEVNVMTETAGGSLIAK